MKTVSAMTMRRHLGALLDEVRLRSQKVIIERDGKPAAMLTPVVREEDADMRQVRLVALDRCTRIGNKTERGRDAARWVAEERTHWADRGR